MNNDSVLPQRTTQEVLLEAIRKREKDTGIELNRQTLRLVKISLWVLALIFITQILFVSLLWFRLG